MKFALVGVCVTTANAQSAWTAAERLVSRPLVSMGAPQECGGRIATSYALEVHSRHA
eukprot:gene23298-9596_t